MTKRNVQRSESLKAALIRLSAAVLCVGVFCGVGRIVSSTTQDSDQGRFVGFLNNSAGNLVVYEGDFLSGGESKQANSATLGASFAFESADAQTATSSPQMIGVKHSETRSPLNLNEDLATSGDAAIIGAEFVDDAVAESAPNDDWQSELALTPYETPTFVPLQAKVWSENATLTDDAFADDVALLFAPSTLIRPDGSLVYEPATSRESTRFFAETKAEQNASVRRGDVAQVGAVVSSNALSSQLVDNPVYLEGASRNGVGIRRGAMPGTGAVSISVN
ncbi:MAG: hypothetical protein IK077_04460 [Thermoguttaceae bacterium]|nr:hypothetical protein [Thermoguttaceae bacterium]